VTATLSPTTAEGFSAFAIQNDHVRVVVIPELGGRIWSLTDLVRDRQWIWHAEDVPLTAAPPGDDYDRVWAGGWEELFPNDAPGVFEGRELPDHGEWWTMRWDVEEMTQGPVARIRLTAISSVVQAECSKEIELVAGEASVRVVYRIRSREKRSRHVLFKQHLPVAVNPGCRLLLPGGRVTPVDESFGTLLGGSPTFTWPATLREGRTIDLRVIPDRSSRHREFVYVTRLQEGWCAVSDARSAASLRMDFSLRELPFLWLFLSYGGWRDTYTVVLEPCTTVPKDLEAAAAAGTTARLEVDRMFETAVQVTLGGPLEPER
jgi:hypothetical protein